MMSHVHITLTHINIQARNDGLLTGSEDEIYCVVTWSAPPIPAGGGPSLRKIGGIVGEVDLGSWQVTPSAQNINATLMNAPLDGLATHINLAFKERDSFSSSDDIGSVSFDLRTGHFSPGADAQAFGQTIPGSWDFKLTGSGASYSVWLQGTVS